MKKIYENYLEHLEGCAAPNSRQKFYATDHPNLWLKTKDRDVLLQRATPYQYIFNSQGLRCDEFSIPSDLPIVFLGCSNTCGVALQLDKTWPSVLLDKIRSHKNKSIPLWSLATAGSSVDKQAILLEKYASILKPRFIFFLIPFMYRRIISLNNQFVEYLPMHRPNQWRPDGLTQQIGKFDAAFTEEDYAIFETFKNLLHINRIALQYNATVFYDCWDNEIDSKIIHSLCSQLSQFKFLETFFIPVGCARDGSHMGPITHRNFAEQIFEKIRDII
jgi:hypothetical protein